jgi:hypothetical protein
MGIFDKRTAKVSEAPVRRIQDDPHLRIHLDHFLAEEWKLSDDGRVIFKTLEAGDFRRPLYLDADHQASTPIDGPPTKQIEEYIRTESLRRRAAKDGVLHLYNPEAELSVTEQRGQFWLIERSISTARAFWDPDWDQEASYMLLKFYLYELAETADNINEMLATHSS